MHVCWSQDHNIPFSESLGKLGVLWGFVYCRLESVSKRTRLVRIEVFFFPLQNNELTLWKEDCLADILR